MSAQPHSDLEVANPNPTDTQKYPYYASNDAPIPNPAYSTDTNKIAYEGVEHEQPAPQTVCGLRKRTFWILVGVALVIVAAAVGGGVGGALASRSSSESNKGISDNNNSSSSSSSSNAPQTTQSSSQSSTTSPPSSSSSVPSSTIVISTSTIIGPTNSPVPTLLRDCPSSNDTLYTVTYGSTAYQYRKLCSNAYVNIAGVAAPVQGVFGTLNECIDKCAIYNRNNATRIAAGTDPVCNAVCWRNTFDERNDWEGGHCFGYTTGNATVAGQTQFRITNTGDICDSAALINQNF